MFQRSLTIPQFEGKNSTTPPAIPQLIGKPHSEVKTLLPSTNETASSSALLTNTAPNIAPLARLASLKLKEGETVFSKIANATADRKYTLGINSLQIPSPKDLSSGSKISPSGIKEVHKELYKVGYNSETIRMSASAAYLLSREMIKATADDIKLTKEQLISEYGEISLVISDPSITDLKILRNAYYRYIIMFIIREAAENAVLRKHKTISDVDIIEANYVLDILKLPRMRIDSASPTKPLTKNEFFNQWKVRLGYTPNKDSLVPPKSMTEVDIAKIDADIKSAEKDYALIGDVLPLNKYEHYLKSQFPGSRFEYGCLNFLYNLTSVEIRQMQQNALDHFNDYSLSPVEVYKQFSERKLQYIIEGMVKFSGPQAKPSPVDFKVTPIWNRIQEIWIVLMITNIRALVTQSPKIEAAAGLVPSRARTKTKAPKTSQKELHTIPFYVFFDAWFGTPKIIGVVEYSS